MMKNYIKKKKAKDKLRALQKKYSFLLKMVKEKQRVDTPLYKATLVDLGLKDIKMIYKGNLIQKRGNVRFENYF